MAAVEMSNGGSVPASPFDGSNRGEFDFSQNGESETLLLRSNRGSSPRAPIVSEFISMSHSAADTGSIKMLKFWLKDPSEVNKVTNAGKTGLMLAACKGHVPVIELYCNHGADVHLVDIEGKTAFLYAVEYGQEEVAYLLHQRGSDVKIADLSGTTALMYASSIGNLTLVKYLYDHGCDINGISNSGYTAVIQAARYGHTKVVKYFCTLGADLSVREKKYGRSALTYATKNNFPEVVKVLCGHGARVDDTVKTGMTALHLAAVQGYHQIVKVLLAYGASLKVEDKYNNTPEDLAKSSRHTEIEDVLHRARKGKKPHKARINIKFKSYVKIVKSDAKATGEDDWIYQNILDKPEADGGTVDYENVPLETAHLVLSNPIAGDKDEVIYEECDIIVGSKEINNEGSTAAEATSMMSEAATSNQLPPPVPLSTPPVHPSRRGKPLRASPAVVGQPASTHVTAAHQPVSPTVPRSPPPLSRQKNPPKVTDTADDLVTLSKQRTAEDQLSEPLSRSSPPRSPAQESASPEDLQPLPLPRPAESKLVRAGVTYKTRLGRHTSRARSSSENSDQPETPPPPVPPQTYMPLLTATSSGSSKQLETPPPVPPQTYKKLLQHRADQRNDFIESEGGAAASEATSPPPPLQARSPPPTLKAPKYFDAEALGATSCLGDEHSDMPPGPPPSLPPPRRNYEAIVKPVYDTVQKCLKDFEKEHGAGCYRQYTSCTTATTEKDGRVNLTINVNFCSHHRVNCQTLNVRRSEFMAANNSRMSICQGCRLRRNHSPEEQDERDMFNDDDDNTTVKAPYCTESEDDDYEDEEVEEKKKTTDDSDVQTFVKQTDNDGDLAKDIQTHVKGMDL